MRSISHYMAPQQWQEQPIPASDQYALGVMAYELLVGRLPFQGEAVDLMNQHFNIEPQSPSVLNPQLSKDIDFVLLQTLAKTPEGRFASVSEFDRAFQHAVQELPMIPNEPQAVLNEQTPAANQHEPITCGADRAEIPSNEKVQDANQSRIYQMPFFPQIRLPLLTIILVALAILMTIGSSLVYYTAVYRPGQFYAQSTATILAGVTATTQANSRATAAAQTATAFQDKFDQITARTPTFNDAMTDPNDNKWGKGSNPQGSCNLTDKGYSIKVSGKSEAFSCSAKNTNFSNFVYQVQMQINQGDYGGLLFRSDPNKGIGYGFFVGTDGSYALWSSTGFNHKTKLLGEGTNILLSRGQTYRVAVVAQGNTFGLYINGSYIKSAYESSATSNSGMIGLTAGTENTNSADIAYTQVQLWQL